MPSLCLVESVLMKWMQAIMQASMSHHKDGFYHLPLGIYRTEVYHRKNHHLGLFRTEVIIAKIIISVYRY